MTTTRAQRRPRPTARELAREIQAVLATARHLSGYAQQLQVGVGIVSVLLSWFLVHTVFTAR